MASPMSSKSSKEVTQTVLELYLRLKIDGFVITRFHTDRGREFQINFVDGSFQEEWLALEQVETIPNLMVDVRLPFRTSRLWFVELYYKQRLGQINGHGLYKAFERVSSRTSDGETHQVSQLSSIRLGEQEDLEKPSV